MRWLGRHWIPIALFLLGLLVYGVTAGPRFFHQSTDPHFALLASAWLDGRLDIDPGQKKGDDWAVVETAELADGSVVRGRHLVSRPTFRIAGGKEIPAQRVVRVRARTYHVSFPPFPAVLLLPHALLGGPRGNDVSLTVLCAAAILPLCFLVLVRLRDAGLSRRTSGENLWLVVALAFGSVLFFSAVQGRVWFTAHVVAVALTLCYALCAIEARHPVLAGLCLGLATMTRPPLALMAPLFLCQAWRVAAHAADDLAASPITAALARRRRYRDFLARAARFAAPIVIIAVVAMAYNYRRFADPLEFGHSYLDVRQQQQMESLGLFSYDFLSRNLAVAFTLLPSFHAARPYISISGHGLALWVTSPVLLYLLWPRERNALHRPLWLTVALIAVPTLFYQNSGWVQFGYRFSLDYLPFLVLLLAIGGRPLGRVARGLIVLAVVVNLFGAVTFARYYRFYRTDTATYNTVIEH